MRAILVRVGIDHSYGAWNAPVDSASGEFVFVPIPEGTKSQFYRGMGRTFREVVPAIVGFLRKHGAGDLQSLRWPRELNDRYMHLDPDFEHLTYGNRDNAKGTKFRNLQRDDLIVFYSGLRPIQPVRDRLIYALIGIMVVDEVVAAHEVSRDRWHQNAHTRKSTRGEHDIVVRARPGVSGRFALCIDIGEFRNRAYRVRHEVLKAWGGLSVKDGYLQRSANPPRFVDPERFLRWFQRQQPKLLANNFSVVGPVKTITVPIHRSVSKAKPSSRFNHERASNPKVIIVHLRRPRMSDPNESRSDPFYELGSFGCTKCHRRNLMNPKRADELNGARLAFAQGGSGEFRLVLLTPPVRVVRHKDRCEVRWRPIRRPFRFECAPLLISNEEDTNFGTLASFIRKSRRETQCGSFSSRFRSRRTPVPDHIAEEIISVYTNRFKRCKKSDFASCYDETMHRSPPLVDRNRRQTHLRLLREAGAATLSTCRNKRKC